MFEFYTEVLEFKSRDAFRVPVPPEFGPLRVRFMGVNQRHHTMAICPAQNLRDPGLIHLMVEVGTLDAAGRALDRVNSEGFQLSSTLGRHTNDKMVSLYVRAPRRLGHRVRYRRHAGRRNARHRRRDHRRQLQGPSPGE